MTDDEVEGVADGDENGGLIGGGGAGESFDDDGSTGEGLVISRSSYTREYCLFRGDLHRTTELGASKVSYHWMNRQSLWNDRRLFKTLLRMVGIIYRDITGPSS